MTGHSGMEMHQIRAAVRREGGGPLQIESLELEGPRDDEVLVRLVATGICHTDIGFCEAWDGPPVVLGHEGAGVVEQVGGRLTAVKPGDRVVLSYQSCGQCRQCQEGYPAGCQRFWEANFNFARLDGSNALDRSGVRGHFFGQSKKNQAIVVSSGKITGREPARLKFEGCRVRSKTRFLSSVSAKICQFTLIVI